MAKKFAGEPKTFVAIAGGNTLIGREIQELVEDQKLPFHLELLDGEMTGGTLAVREDEALYLPPLTKQTLEAASVVFLAGSPSSHAEALRVAPEGAVLIDLTGAIEDNPGGKLRAPSVEAPRSLGDRAPATGKVPKPRLVRARPVVIAHPAAIALAQLLRVLAVPGTIERSVIVIFEPASERGHPGIGELDKQTRKLLALEPLPHEVFDAQLAFNMLPELGSEAAVRLEPIEERIERHLAVLLAGTIGIPSLRLVQAPVFHGYSFSLWVEFAQLPEISKIESILRAAKVDLRDSTTEPATNVGAAQQSGLTVGSIRRDRRNDKALWLWMVCDNLRVLAENALLVAQEVM